MAAIVTAIVTAAMKMSARRSYRIAIPLQSLRVPNMCSRLWRCLYLIVPCQAGTLHALRGAIHGAVPCALRAARCASAPAPLSAIMAALCPVAMRDITPCTHVICDLARRQADDQWPAITTANGKARAVQAGFYTPGRRANPLQEAWRGAMRRSAGLCRRQLSENLAPGCPAGPMAQAACRASCVARPLRRVAPLQAMRQQLYDRLTQAGDHQHAQCRAA